jgi:eukaryotic-like serine/threonine-protein kinase
MDSILPALPGTSGTWRQPRRRGHLVPGTQVADLSIGDIVGEGGMATVYAATRADGREVAVKVLRQSAARDASTIERFRREATAVLGIGHPAIVAVSEHGRLPDGRPFAVMERLRGHNLAQRLLHGRLSLAEAAAIVTPIVGALQAAHAQQIVHRDIKPENIFLCRDGSVRLLDFGIAQFNRAFDTPGRLTDSGFVIGTPRYLAPEQAQAGELGPATDVYGLGVALFEMLAGRLPFVGDSAASLMTQHLLAPAPRLASYVRVPAMLDELVARMLSKAPDLRPSLDEVRAICEAAVREPSPAAQRWRQIGVIAAAMVAAFGAGWWLAL